MTDRPIIFSAPMIRALLEGRKTQTRRVLKRHALHKPDPHSIVYHDGSLICRWKSGIRHDIPSPYAPGDRLYVKEAWRAMDRQDEFSGSQIAAQCLDAGYKRPWSPIQYEADGARDNWIREPLGFGTKLGRYRHSRFMPRWASRLTLTVTDVRVQRLQDISEADAAAEGCSEGHTVDVISGIHEGWSARTSFRTLWNSLHGTDAWAANPWAVALTFTAHKCNIDQMEGAARIALK